MANTELEFCGLKFKNPTVVASLETTNSPDLIKQCFDAGAAGAIVKTLTDIEDMARLTQNSKYFVMNDKGQVIHGKVPRDFVFYSRSGYSSTHYKDWIPYLKEGQKYAADHGAHLTTRTGFPISRKARSTRRTTAPISSAASAPTTSTAGRTSPAPSRTVDFPWPSSISAAPTRP